MPTSTNTVRIQSSAELTPEVLKSLNNHLSTLEPREILEWAIDHLPNLYQTTAMGLTGMHLFYISSLKMHMTNFDIRPCIS